MNNFNAVFRINNLSLQNLPNDIFPILHSECISYQIKLDADTLLFVTLQERSTDEPLLAKISGAPSIVTVGTAI